MNVEALSDFIENMVLQHDYPGFEPRSLKLGLPESLQKASSKVFSEALGHPSVYVKLAALRWFQEKPGMGKGCSRAIAGLLNDQDPWVKRESIHALEKINAQSDEILMAICQLLEDPDVEVRKAAAKSLGKVCSKRAKRPDGIVPALNKAAEDKDHEVRWKAQKALRLMGAYKD
jgi:HEAT repeat protein